MELHIIGCDGSYPGANGATSGYLLKLNDGRRYLLDCGSGVLSKLMALMDPAELSGILLTHWHNDHAADLLVMRYYLMLHGASLPLYAPITADPIRTLCDCPQFELRDISQGLVDGDLEVDTLPTHHPVACYALRFSHQGKRFVYSGDSGPCDDLAQFSHGCDLLLCDASFLHEEWHEALPHMSALQVGELGKRAAVKRLMLTHCPPSGDAEMLRAEAATAFPGCERAEAGRRYRL